MYTFETKRAAVEYLGVDLSKPGKMPGLAWNLPALVTCPVGARLAKIPGTICGDCYALKGMYRFPVVKDALARRLKATKLPLFVTAMAKLIQGMEYFRWHDSGDVYSMEYLESIIVIALSIPETKFWLPTRETRMIRDWVHAHPFLDIPDNLCIRLSASMIDGNPPKSLGLPTSTVHEGEVLPLFNVVTMPCPSVNNDGECGDCRACWDPRVKNVSYRRH